MKKLLISIPLVALTLIMAACSGSSVSASLLQSSKPRITNPTVTTVDAQTLTDGNIGFAFDIYQSLLTSNSRNLFYSPYSISEALAMSYAGAAGTTATQMAQALNFTLPQSRLHPAFNKLDLDLATRGNNGQTATDVQPFKLNIVNAIWGQKNYPFLSSYLDTLKQNYGAGLRTLDYINNPEASRVAINDWVASQTANKIKDLIPQGVINNQTRLVLTNAIYFNAGWKNRFEKSATTGGTFHNLSGNTASVQIMKLTEGFSYGENADYQAIELPYDGDQIAMDIIMPKSEAFRTFESTLNLNSFNGILKGMIPAAIELTLPKFNIESDLSLKSVLSAMGMTDAFTSNADFSGIDGKKDLFIQDVIHKSFVKVDEDGTEAAAASGVVIGVTSILVPDAIMTINHPFIFIIRDIPTGTILFIGRVAQLES